MRTLDLWLREVAQNLSRHRLMSLAATVTMLMAMLLVGITWVVLENLGQWTRMAADQAQVSVYMTREASRRQAEAVRERLERLPQVRRAVLVTKEEGFARLRQQLKCDPQLLDIPNPLTDGVQVWASSPQALSVVAKAAQRMPAVRSVVHDANTVQALGMIQRVTATASGSTAVFLALMALVVVHSAIRLTLHARRSEIEIMQLVGATPMFVAGPFLLEGACHGVAGGLLAGVLVSLGYAYVRGVWSTALPFLPLLPLRLALEVGAGVLLGGVLLGVSGSALSLRRYLGRSFIG